MTHGEQSASHQQCDQLSCLGLDALLVLVILVVILTVIALASVLCVCVIQQLTTSSVNATSHLTCLPVSRTSYHIISSQQKSTLYFASQWQQSKLFYITFYFLRTSVKYSLDLNCSIILLIFENTSYHKNLIENNKLTTLLMVTNYNKLHNRTRLQCNFGDIFSFS